MKLNTKSILACAALSTLLFSCQKQDKAPATTSVNGISSEVIAQIAAKGFATEGAYAVEGGYVVEGDIFLSHSDVKNLVLGPDLRVGDEEQYHTTNLIKNLPRTITVSIDGLDAMWYAATDTALARYNALGMRLSFQRVASGGQIVLVGKELDPGVLGTSGGFPDANGNPPSPITFTTRAGAFGSNPNVKWLATIVAHEIGHTIGFRHTDYKNRKYSCGGLPIGEGKAGVGAIWIPGTPTKGDPNSWMLACTDGTDRPFNANDVIALNYLYH